MAVAAAAEAVAAQVADAAVVVDRVAAAADHGGRDSAVANRVWFGKGGQMPSLFLGSESRQTIDQIRQS